VPGHDPEFQGFNTEYHVRSDEAEGTIPAFVVRSTEYLTLFGLSPTSFSCFLERISCGAYCGVLYGGRYCTFIYCSRLVLSCSWGFLQFHCSLTARLSHTRASRKRSSGLVLFLALPWCLVESMLLTVLSRSTALNLQETKTTYACVHVNVS
jgi:hypothetical protein